VDYSPYKFLKGEMIMVIAYLLKIEADEGVEINAKNLVVRYGPTTALDNLSVEIPSGIVGLLGPNGAGKSTFIKTLLGLLDPNSGIVRVRGLDPRGGLCSDEGPDWLHARARLPDQ
jgi:ABC-type uncharacterized transport system ATPase subunit